MIISEGSYLKLDIDTHTFLINSIALTFGHVAYDVMSGYLSVFIRTNSVYANMGYLSVSGRIAYTQTWAICPYPSETYKLRRSGDAFKKKQFHSSSVSKKKNEQCVFVNRSCCLVSSP